MKYLVDANVLSEPTKPIFSPQVVEWLNANESELVVNSIVMAEIWRGVDDMPEGRKKRELAAWFRDLRTTTHCLEWTLETAIVWAEMVNHIKRTGYTVGTMDTMIAATAKHHGLTVATRNVDDFTRCGVPVVNPFEKPSA